MPLSTYELSQVCAIMGKVLLDAGALLAPVPSVIVSLGEGDGANLITVGWTGILCTRPPMTYIAVRPERHSYSIIRRTGEFVINLTDSSMAEAADICGMYTGRKRDKAAMAGLTLEDSFRVACPSVAQSPVSLECRVERVIPLGSHQVFVARILCCAVRDDLMGPDGRMCLDSAEMMAYAHGEYYALGRKLGKFGFSAAKRKQKKRRGKVR